MKKKKKKIFLIIFDNIEKENGQIEIRTENNEPKIKTEEKIQ